MENSYPFEKEDRGWLEEQAEMPQAFMSFQRPKEVRNEWHRKENQGRIGSCQGNGLASCLERLHYVNKRQVVQLSRIFGYIATQKIDGLIGQDRGSTISGGAKLATKVGLPLESVTGYPSAYPNTDQRTKILSAANYAAAAPYKATSICVFTAKSEPDDLLNFIGGGGAISFGIKWPGIPADRVIRKFAPPSNAGGHANGAIGYLENGNLEPWNSWNDGPYQITPDALRQMLRHPYSAFIGLMGETAGPVDWISNSPWNFQG